MDLICYTYPGWEPRLRAAGPKRDWMEATPERFAYRCLPLAIANAHGWEILSPCGFEARWRGGQGAEAVEIRLDPGADPKRAPVSLFGQGTITFHVEGIFRTEPGWNLWLCGPPNAAKDGIAPLGGVVEADWSPYTFTMNWRFTRPNQWVRFEENEPFCFFFPVQRDAIAEIAPQLRPMTDEPGLTEKFEAWSRSRDTFQSWVAETRPEAPADKWQKLYYRGVHPDGAPGPADHKAKLRLEPFRLADGSAPEPPAPKNCPVAHGPPAAVPPAILATASPMQNPALALTLGRLGFDPAAAPSPLLAAQSKPQPQSNGALAGRRRDWILDVMEAQRALAPSAQEVPRVRNLSSEDFLAAHYAPGRPVVIEGAMADWAALKRWSPDYLRRKLGKAPVEFQAGRETDPDFELNKDRHKQVGPFDAFIDRIRSGAGNDLYLTAYNSDRNRAALRPLDKDLGHLNAYLTKGAGMIWIGPAGTFTPLHFDLTNNLIGQLVGTKELLLAPPSETPKLAHRRHVFSDVHDLADAARLAAYPRARDARTFAVTLSPGDLLYVPIGWWHQVRARDFSVTMTWTNFRWPNAGWESYPTD